jgi:glycosyltransferase involved in cell wall biosynthesis
MIMIKNVVIATHTFSPGTSQALYHYFNKKKIPVLLIEHPLFGNLFSWFYDAIDTFFSVYWLKETNYLYIGSNRLNAFIGIILKNLKKVNTVVYFSPDWSPNRFNNSILNYFFQKLDYYCVKQADIVWNSSAIMPIDPMMREREKLGYPKSWRKKQIQVPDGTDRLPIVPFSKINRYQIAFVGHLIKSVGIQLAIESLAEVQKQIPKVNLIIIGTGPLEDELKKRVKKLHIKVKFYGYINNINKVYKILSTCAFALAPYEQSNDNISQYTDPGKIKNYLSLGLPIIITKVPRIANEIKNTSSGVKINFSKNELSEAMLKLLKSDSLLIEYRYNVQKLAKKYEWNKVFDRALSYV